MLPRSRKLSRYSQQHSGMMRRSSARFSNRLRRSSCTSGLLTVVVMESGPKPTIVSSPTPSLWLETG
jgi:hypothetical protein